MQLQTTKHRNTAIFPSLLTAPHTNDCLSIILLNGFLTVRNVSHSTYRTVSLGLRLLEEMLLN